MFAQVLGVVSVRGPETVVVLVGYFVEQFREAPPLQINVCERASAELVHEVERVILEESDEPSGQHLAPQQIVPINQYC